MGFIGFCSLGLRVGPTWTLVVGNTRAPRGNLLQVPMGPAVATHMWPMRVHRTGHSWSPWDFASWDICQNDDNKSDMNLIQGDTSSR